MQCLVLIHSQVLSMNNAQKSFLKGLFVVVIVTRTEKKKKIQAHWYSDPSKRH